MTPNQFITSTSSATPITIGTQGWTSVGTTWDSVVTSTSKTTAYSDTWDNTYPYKISDPVNDAAALFYKNYESSHSTTPKTFHKETQEEKIKRLMKKYSSYNIKDVKIEYKTIKHVNVNNKERDENGNYKVTTTYLDMPEKVIVTFKDGSVYEAVCDKDDTFNIEVGISICLTKKLLADIVSSDSNINPTKVYNDIIKGGLKKYKEHIAKEEEAEKKEEMAKIKAAAKQRRRLHKAEKKKEREINILAEAIRRAKTM